MARKVSFVVLVGLCAAHEGLDTLRGKAGAASLTPDQSTYVVMTKLGVSLTGAYFEPHVNRHHQP